MLLRQAFVHYAHAADATKTQDLTGKLVERAVAAPKPFLRKLQAKEPTTFQRLAATCTATMDPG